MFDGVVPEHFHQFISSLPLSFNPPIFDSPQFQFQQQQLQLHQQCPTVSQQQQQQQQQQQIEAAKRKDKLLPTEAASDHHNHHHHLPWSKDEVLSLLKIRSGMDTNWFPDFSNWDHVSRKLGELGFQRSGDKCKEKFEEESTNLMSYNTNNLNDLEKLCGAENQDPKVADDQNNRQLPEKSREEEEVDKMKQTKQCKKRKRHGGDDEHYYHQKLEMLKSFCEEVVNKMMSLQEDLYNKILQDMVRRDNENIVREEDWKKQDMERFEKEFQFRANQQAVAGDRHTKLIHFLNNFTMQNPNPIMVACDKEQNPPANPSPMAKQSPLMTTSSTESLSSIKNPVRPKPQKASGRDGDDDIGKRWPKDQVIALINLRCSIVMNGNSIGGAHDQQEKELLGGKGPLWERISQGMLEMGYKRSAKRCKEKWENINKYFRKTKDNNVNKKRSLDSRTCPYFHLLNSLYSQGILGMPPLEGTPENHGSGDVETIPRQMPVDKDAEICC